MRDHLVAEILDGLLITHPRPAARHARAEKMLIYDREGVGRDGSSSVRGATMHGSARRRSPSSTSSSQGCGRSNVLTSSRLDAFVQWLDDGTLDLFVELAGPTRALSVANVDYALCGVRQDGTSGSGASAGR